MIDFTTILFSILCIIIPTLIILSISYYPLMNYKNRHERLDGIIKDKKASTMKKLFTYTIGIILLILTIKIGIVLIDIVPELIKTKLK